MVEISKEELNEKLKGFLNLETIFNKYCDEKQEYINEIKNLKNDDNVDSASIMCKIETIKEKIKEIKQKKNTFMMAELLMREYFDSWKYEETLHKYMSNKKNYISRKIFTTETLIKMLANNDW